MMTIDSPPASPGSARKRVWAVSLLAFLFTLALNLAHVGFPSMEYWDEVFYVADGRAYARPGGRPTNFEHPPLGKLLIGLSIRAFGDRPWAWRLPSAVAGAAVAGAMPVFLAPLLSPGCGALVLALPSLLVALDPVVFTTSRIAMLEMPLVLFMVLASLFFLHSLRRAKGWLLALLATGVLTGLALATKWTALCLLPCFAIVHMAGIEDPRNIRINWRRVLALSALPLAVYLATFLVAGERFGSVARSQFRMAVHHTWYFFATPAWSSRWFDWLVSRGAIWYLPPTDLGPTRIIAAVGSPATWLAGAAATLVGLVASWKPRDRVWLTFALLGFLQFGLWVVALRLTFIYYMAAVSPFFALSIATALDRLRARGWPRLSRGLALGLVLAASAQALVLAPVTTGAPLSATSRDWYFGAPLRWLVCHHRLGCAPLVSSPANPHDRH